MTKEEIAHIQMVLNNIYSETKDLTVDKILNAIEDLKADLCKEELAYINLRKSFIKKVDNWNALKKKAIDYGFNKTGSHEDGRYCVAISVTDLLKWMEELEGEDE